MEERREIAGGRRRGDQPPLFRWIFLLLVAVLLLQGLNTILHYQRKSKEEAPADSLAGSERRSPDDESVDRVAAEVPPLVLSDDPLARRVVNRLSKGLEATAAKPAQGSIGLDAARIAAATGIGEILVVAELQSSYPLPLERAIGVLQLRSAAGALVYQATSEIPLLAAAGVGRERLAQAAFLVDNPPEFESAEVFLKRVDFQVEGFR